eukprot:GEZU01017814.1.p1 GENE.GEZU01017814.1~~GEZU01017814.1.p1  ORF type:complete len:309 (-),score=25.92 GEZU01017814.1:192-1118(-)
MVLTEKQKQDLHAAIFEYLASQGFENTKREFAKEAKLNEDELEQSSATTAQLEKKWTSVVRLQKKVMELEALVEAQKQQIDDFKSGAAYKQSKGTDYVPVAPAKFELSGHRAPVTGVLFHPTFNLLVSASEDASIRVWDFESGELEKSMRGHTNAVQHVSFDRTGNFLASCSADLSIKLWDFKTYECIKTMNGHEHNVSCVEFMPDGDHLISCSRDKTIKIWEIATGYCKKTIEGHSDWVRRVITSRDGTTIVSCSMDQTIRIWNNDGQCLQVLQGHENVVECICLSPESVNPIIREAFPSLHVGLHF